MVDSLPWAQAVSRVLGSSAAHPLLGTHGPGQVLPVTLDSIPSLSTALLSSAAAHAPPDTHGPGETLQAANSSAVHSNLSPRIQGLLTLPVTILLVTMTMTIPVPAMTMTILTPAFAHGPPGSHGPSCTILAASATVDSHIPSNSPSRSPGPGLSTAFCPGSVAAHPPPSIRGPSHTLSTLGVAATHETHRRLYWKMRHPTPHYCKTILSRTLHRGCRRRARWFLQRIRIGC